MLYQQGHVPTSSACFIPVFQEEIAFTPKWENTKLKKWKPCTSSVLCRDWLGIGYMFDQCCSLRLEVHHRAWVYRTFGTECWGAGKFLAYVRAERRKRGPDRLLGASALQRCFLGVCGMGLKEKMRNSFHLMCDWQGSVYREISSLALQWEH